MDSSRALTPTPTTTKPGKGCGDKNHLHERRFECKIVITDVRKKEGDSGTTTFVFTVAVSGSPLRTVTVDWATAAGATTARKSVDQATSGQLTCPTASSA